MSASQPAPTATPAFSSAFQLGALSLPGAGGDAWTMDTAPVSSRACSLGEKLLDLQQEDPLLATMDSLSIRSDESCSNKELFSALEGLGLNAEDLELLLLDEKAVMVNVEPDQTPSLDSSLASSQIVPYIPSSPVKEHEGGQQVCPLPGTSPSPRDGSAPCHSENKDSSCHLAQRGTWEQPLGAVPGQLPELAEQEEPSSGSQWRAAGEETLLPFLQGTPWDEGVPSSAPGAPCLQEPPRAQQLQGDFPAVQPLQGDAHQSFFVPSQCQASVALPSLLKHRPLLMNGVCGHSPSSSPWQDCVSPLVGSPAQPGSYGLSPDLLSQQQGCLGPGVSPQPLSPSGFGSTDPAGPGGSRAQGTPYPRVFCPSYQLVPDKQLSPVRCCQQPFPSSAAGRCGSMGSPLEPLHPHGTHASVGSQECRHRVRAWLCSGAQRVCWECAQPVPRAPAKALTSVLSLS